MRRFLKGVFELSPSFPRYQCIWDVNIVLDYLRTTFMSTGMSLKSLTLKLVILLALLTGQRHQTLHCLRLDGLTLESNKCVFCITEVLKHTRPGHHQKPIELLAFEPDHRLCVIWHLKEYLHRTKELRNGEQRLFLSFQRPHKAVSKETIARWTKTVLSLSGIDVKVFTSHSTRAASTSAVNNKGTQLQVILDSAGWSSCKTFAVFYNKPILNAHNFGAALLEDRQ